MQRKNKGFTLIELLVVVLIIGILAAVALPQYQKAVEKSRLSEAKLMLRSLYNASQLCVLQYGAGSEQCKEKLFDNIDIALPSEVLEGDDCGDNGCFKTKDWEYGIDWGCYPAACLYAYPRQGNYYLEQDDHDTDGKLKCVSEDNFSVSLCGSQACFIP